MGSDTPEETGEASTALGEGPVEDAERFQLLQQQFPEYAEELERLRQVCESQEIELGHVRPRAALTDDLELANHHLLDRITELEKLGRIDKRTKPQDQEEYGKVCERLANDRRRHEDLVYVDLDNFKRVNDTPGLGHRFGDVLLEQIGAIMRAEFGRNAFRCGNGDEVAGLAPQGEGLAAAERVRVAWSIPDHTFLDPHTGERFVVRLSIGVGCTHEEAEAAMYAEKRRNGGGSR